jgi:hypothetical protein
MRSIGKFVFRSKDADYFSNNSLADGKPNLHIFNEVNFPEGIEGMAILVMDSFVAQNLNGELDGGYTLSIKDLIQPKTWGSDKNGSTDILFAGRGGLYQNGSVCIDSCGIPITNPTFFRNSRITVELNTIKADYPDFAVVGDWVLTFYVVQLGGQNVMQP